ncbi:hypothetical protein [Streptomyces sp. AC555_RSS877]|uniref:ATP-dependent DNA ligase n=1 Tax=Streptomyces sp. AC555_RSS877 TaxID=2823688 RepID=UPI001C273B37|nr:hypothetical protein [Streptomyces sp. AC555_RSS877]
MVDRGVGFRSVRPPESTNLLAFAFDLLRLEGTDTTQWPYRRRRAALEDLFAERTLTAPWALCPSTTDADTIDEWLTWSAVGLEGIVFKRLDSRYEPVRGWLALFTSRGFWHRSWGAVAEYHRGNSMRWVSP